MDIIANLVEALRCLPGVGPKSAQRMVFHLLQHSRDRGLRLAACLEIVMRDVVQCVSCNNYTLHHVCDLCTQIDRNDAIVCVVENPLDVMAIEQSHSYNGKYYVLMGKISPIDGIGPSDLGLPKLLERVMTSPVQEVILALNPSVEGQTTMHYIQELLKHTKVSITQLAHGIPIGGDLVLLDAMTIGRALKKREIIDFVD
jgi:recombination protein RecR